MIFFRNKGLFAALLVVSTVMGYPAEPAPKEGLPVFWWNEKWRGRTFVNFGDYISLKLVERIVGKEVRSYTKRAPLKEKKLLASGSILSFAFNDDVVWGAAINGKLLKKEDYQFDRLDVRAVRGPLTREFLKNHFQIDCPPIYGDPTLLVPWFFPEFKRAAKPALDYLIIVHYSEDHLFPKGEWDNVVFSTDPLDVVLSSIVNSRFVISSSLHGIIIAEAYGIPARLLKITNNEPMFKFQDYYLGTNRPHFQYATSVEEAFEMGGEPPFKCDLEKLYKAFPFEFWPNTQFPNPKFRRSQ